MVKWSRLSFYFYTCTDKQKREREKKTSAISSQFTLRKVCEMPKSIWNMSRLDYIFFHEKSKKKKMQSRKEHANLWGIRCNYPMTFSIFRPLGLNPGVEQVMDFDIKRKKFVKKIVPANVGNRLVEMQLIRLSRRIWRQVLRFLVGYTAKTLSAPRAPPTHHREGHEMCRLGRQYERSFLFSPF